MESICNQHVAISPLNYFILLFKTGKHLIVNKKNILRMEKIKVYVSAIDSQSLRFFSGKCRQFIELVKKGKKSEKEITEIICEGKYDISYYRNIKSKSKKILQKLVIISASGGGSQVKKKYDICQKNFTLGQKFLNKGERIEGLRLIKKAYHIAIEFDFVYLAYELSSILQHDHLYYHRNGKLADFYGEQVDRYLRDYTAEKKAEYYFFRIIQPKSKSINIKQIEHAVVEIEQNKGKSAKYLFYNAAIKIMQSLYIGDYKQLIQYTTATLQILGGRKGAYSSYYYFLLMNQGLAQLAIARYTNANISFHEATQFTPPKSINDYLLRYYKTLNALHADDYQLAYELYQQNKKCRFELIKQQFAIIEAYLYFLSYTGHFQLNRPFRLGKYLNETFKAQTDKQGDNINILIAELLVYLARDRGKFIDRIESIEDYSYRHLRGKDTQRAKWFIKILCMMPKVNFHPVALKRKAKRYFDLLESHPVRMGEGFAVEIIPYTDLLNMIVERLLKKVA